MSALRNLKASNAPAARLSNWNMITQAIEGMQTVLGEKDALIDQDTKSLLLAADIETFQEVRS